jgi:hypothetical protein
MFPITEDSKKLIIVAFLKQEASRYRSAHLGPDMDPDPDPGINK